MELEPKPIPNSSTLALNPQTTNPPLNEETQRGILESGTEEDFSGGIHSREDVTLPSPPQKPSTPDPPPTSSPRLIISRHDVREELRRLLIRKAPGPDFLSTRFLRVCANQLDSVFQGLFNLSLRLNKIPKLWKTSCIVPLPKKGRPNGPNDYRPVALTSHVMKVFERLVLQQLRPMVKEYLDPLQFAYQAKIGVEDAIICLLHRAYSHLENPGAVVRIMFFDFSSAFNTILPLRLAEKLSAMKVNTDLVAWITDYLTGRPQYVRLSDSSSEVVTSNTGAPQGTVLSPFLFTLYTTDFSYNSGKCHLQKFSDDSTILGCISEEGGEEEYRQVVRDFVSWADTNHLQLNTSKTKELVIDLRRRKNPPRPAPTAVNIRGDEVEMADSCKFLGVHLNNRLDWSNNTDALYKKGQSRLYFLRRLRSFGVCNRLLRMFYQSVVASALFFAVACWGSSAKKRETDRLNKLVKKASSVVGEKLDSMEEIGQKRLGDKLLSIMDNPSHPLFEELDQRRSSFSHRLILPHIKTDRFGNSFIPAAIKWFNKCH